ncbi:MAG: chemotaxis protein CheW [Pseudomonadaceae bacterium]
MASDALETLNSLIVPLREQSLLLPNVAVAELVGFRLSEAVSHGPDWFLGWTLWRDQQVPMVDLDVLMGSTAAVPEAQPRTLILNALGGTPGVHFIGLRVWGIPRSRKLQRADLTSTGAADSWTLQQVSLSDEPEDLLIPDLQALEQALEQAGLLRRAG